MTSRASLARLAALAAGLAGAAGPAAAHPHVFIDAQIEILFDTSGHVTGVRQAWTFDAASSAFYIQGYDANRDGSYSREELAPLAQINVDSLASFGFFTGLRAGSLVAEFAPPRDYFLDVQSGILTLHFTLPTRQPVAVASLPAELTVADPEYYVAFSFAAQSPVTLVGAPAGCTAQIVLPLDLTPALAAQFAAIPAGAALPANLAVIARDISNGVQIQCP